MLQRSDRYPTPIRRLVFDGVPLLPRVVGPPWSRHRAEDEWCLPDSGQARRRTATTQELFARARRLGVGCYLFVRKKEIAT
jgi:hypothetical protein